MKSSIFARPRLAEASPRQAFTIIELLIVIAIIGLLTAIVMTNFGTSKGKARDAKRFSDIGNLQLALELYFDRCRQYPVSTGPDGNNFLSSSGSPGSATLNTTHNNGCPAGISLASFISVIPSSPNPGTYDYAVNDTGKPTDYVLHTTLEYTNELIKDGLSGNIYGQTCENTIGATDYCRGPK